MNHPLDARQAVWSRYWSRGAAHSCGGSYGNRYEGALAAFWRTAFAQLPADARLLDIATGNGPLPRLLLDCDPDGSSSCDALDLATLAPEWVAELTPALAARVRFHGGQVAEALPFADASFDMVMSQYGLEYTSLGSSVPELLRVLKPAGQVRLVLHHAQARPVLLAVAELEHMAWMDAPGGMLDTVESLMPALALAGTEQGRAQLAGDVAAEAARTKFNALQAEATRLASASICPDVLLETREHLFGILNLAMAHGEAQGRHALEQLCADLADSALRLQELIQYALDAPAAQALCAELAGNGRRAELHALEDQGQLMGWTISVTRMQAA
jgi:SAM-dependent methyltransferase